MDSGLDWFDLFNLERHEIVTVNIFKRDKWGCVPLHHAAKNGNCKLVKSLRETRFLLDRDGWTALNYAELNRQLRVIKLLLDAFKMTTKRNGLTVDFGDFHFSHQYIFQMVQSYISKQKEIQDIFPLTFLQI